jgi:hypothetical protein
MTYVTDLGYKVGDRFKLINGEGCKWLISDGYLESLTDEFMLYIDDTTSSPAFIGKHSYFFTSLKNVARVEHVNPIEPEKKLNATSLAQHLVSKLFELGNEGGKLTNRISFMIGTYGVDEECSGGMNKVALEKFFERVIASYKEAQ